MKRLRVVACDVLRREMYWCAARAARAVEVALLPKGLHSDADRCRARLQPAIDETDPARYEALLLGYGLCNNSLVGLRAARVPLVVPRAHDCITLLLGSKERYAALFAARPGTYWFSSGWIESKDGEDEAVEPPDRGAPGSALRHARYEELVAKYGEENARYVAEVLGGWQQHYTHGTFIEFEFDRDGRPAEEARRISEERGWQFARLPGDLGLIQDGLDGRWDPARFLVVRPGQVIRASYDDGIVAAEDLAASARRPGSRGTDP